MPHPGAEFEAILRGARALVDVRTPAEFAKGHVAGAVNIPLFSDTERAEIGTLYKQVGKQDAVRRGLDLVGARLRDYVERFGSFQGQALVVYCARGGMRSQSVVSLLSSLGYKTAQLPGGYKAYRNYVLARLDVLVPPRVLVLHGHTGVGKTLLLRRLRNVLDLEDAAQHRSSLFGAVNLQPHSQQRFETELLTRLEALDFSRPVWIEGESRKVGDAVIPTPLREAMRGGVCVLATAPLEARVQRIVAEYGAPDEATRAQLGAALRKLTPYLGHGQVNELAALVDAGDFAPVVRVLLSEHYDPRYAHSMRHYRYAATVDCTDLDAAAAELQRFWEVRAARGDPAEEAPPSGAEEPDGSAYAEKRA